MANHRIISLDAMNEQFSNVCGKGRIIKPNRNHYANVQG